MKYANVIRIANQQNKKPSKFFQPEGFLYKAKFYWKLAADL